MFISLIGDFLILTLQSTNFWSHRIWFWPCSPHDSRKSVQEGKMDMRDWGAGWASQPILFPMIPCSHWKVRSSDISCRATHETDLARAGCKWIWGKPGERIELPRHPLGRIEMQLDIEECDTQGGTVEERTGRWEDKWRRVGEVWGYNRQTRVSGDEKRSRTWEKAVELCISHTAH